MRVVFGAWALSVDVLRISGSDEWFCGGTFTVLRQTSAVDEEWEFSDVVDGYLFPHGTHARFIQSPTPSIRVGVQHD